MNSFRRLNHFLWLFSFPLLAAYPSSYFATSKGVGTDPLGRAVIDYTISSTALPVLANVPHVFSNFKAKAQVSFVFVEHDKHVLLLTHPHQKHSSPFWGVPQGKVRAKEDPLSAILRALKQETKINLLPSSFTYHGKHYARLTEGDYVVHIYHVGIKQRPKVQFAPKTRTAYEWVSMYTFKLMPLVEGQKEIFDVVYADRMWQKTNSSEIGSEAYEKMSLVLQKGSKVLVFDKERRLILNLMGSIGAEKEIEGETLSKLFGLPVISLEDICQDEYRMKFKLAEIMQRPTEQPSCLDLSDEVSIGIVAKRLSRPDCDQGFILNDFPQTQLQAEITRSILIGRSDFFVPIVLDVPDQEALKRISQQYICPTCGRQMDQLEENPWPGYCPYDASRGKMIELKLVPKDVDRFKMERSLKIFKENKTGILYNLNRQGPVEVLVLDTALASREVLHQICDHIQTRLDTLS